MKMRLQKVLAQAGIASRRKAESLIAEGRVEVNGQIVREQGTQVEPDRDLIRVEGRLLELERKVHYVLYKPPEVVTTLSDPQGRATLAPLLDAIPERVFAVGRLDYDAEGALIVTNDGALAHRLMHPSFGVPRVYLAKVKGIPTDETLERARRGLRLEDGPVTLLELEMGESAERNTWLKIVLTEGRPHLVKRLCAALGHPVVRLYRPFYGGISAEGLRPGQFRPLTSAELSLLKNGGRRPIPRAADIKAPPRRHRAMEPQTTLQIDASDRVQEKRKLSSKQGKEGARPPAWKKAQGRLGTSKPMKSRPASAGSKSHDDPPMSARFTRRASAGSRGRSMRSSATQRPHSKSPPPSSSKRSRGNR